jgi:hypothetical protein
LLVRNVWKVYTRPTCASDICCQFSLCWWRPVWHVIPQLFFSDTDSLKRHLRPFLVRKPVLWSFVTFFGQLLSQISQSSCDVRNWCMLDQKMAPKIWYLWQNLCKFDIKIFLSFLPKNLSTQTSDNKIRKPETVLIPQKCLHWLIFIT